MQEQPCPKKTIENIKNVMISQVTLQTNQIHHRHMLLGPGPYKTLVIVPSGLLYQDIILGILTCV